MAKTSSRKSHIAPIRSPHVPETGTATAVAEPETPFEAAPPPVEEPPRRGPGRPPIPREKAPPKLLTFLQRVAGIAHEDWGTRAKIRLYRLAPIIDRLRGSDTKFLTMYEEPIDEDRIKHDWGSGRYRLYLGFKAPAGPEKEVDSVEFDIMDMKFPPMVPPGEWVEDTRNKQWAWAKSFFPKDPANGTPAPPVAPPVDPIAAFDTFLNIQDRIESRQKPAEQPPAPLVAPVADPFDTAKKIMEMRQNDPMVAMLLARMEAMDKSAEAARQREYELQKELRQIQTNPATQPKTLAEQFKELASVKDVLKELFGGEGIGAAAVGRRTNWMDMARDIVPQIINSELMAGIGQKIAASATAPANPAMSTSQTPAHGPADTGEAAFTKWIRDVVNKQLIRFFVHMPGMEGGDLADLLYALEPEWTLRLQQFEHAQLPGLKGKEAIVQAYKVTGSVWPQIQASGRAHLFEAFVEQFCNWKPDAEDGEAEDDGVIDLTASPSEEGEREE